MKPLTDGEIERITAGYHKHRQLMDKYYGDDPKYFGFTRVYIIVLYKMRSVNIYQFKINF